MIIKLERALRATDKLISEARRFASIPDWLAKAKQIVPRHYVHDVNDIKDAEEIKTKEK